MFRRKHFVFASKHVNPLYIKQLEQIHRAGWIAYAIPFSPDLL